MADIDRETEQMEQDDQAEAKPFFARFLEDQKRVRTGVKAGRGITTLKHPSDSDESQTMKYPSDGDEEIYAK
ncbi:hypothetical protein SOCEGT47_063870 [Sorangium cellulosum]|uniref:Uncharacterized protein n=1 Tax=Sorangium cellulosum TaxID=56 RepID=A0A4P2Q8D7_SORCE|nr:microviridin/marinostatin family tricyclic proteinase inhibitor [Sorangium cellulosum]AUX25834.1 hypothetical protein SOCEGT47_063870 [Sorangium cellulosum]